MMWLWEALDSNITCLERLGHETDHSSVSRAEVKNAWSCTFTSPLRSRGLVLN